MKRVLRMFAVSAAGSAALATAGWAQNPKEFISWGAVAAWWADNRDNNRLSRDFAFLDEVIPPGTPREVSRADATIGLRQLPPLPPQPHPRKPQ